MVESPARVRPLMTAPPSPRQIQSWQDAEHNAADWLRHWGYVDAVVTPAGPDGGIDILGARVSAQVKYIAAQVGRPDLQRLVGATRDTSAHLFFFTGSAYSDAAVTFARDARIALIVCGLDGSMRPINDLARSRGTPAAVGGQSDCPPPPPYQGPMGVPNSDPRGPRPGAFGPQAQASPPVGSWRQAWRDAKQEVEDREVAKRAGMPYQRPAPPPPGVRLAASAAGSATDLAQLAARLEQLTSRQAALASSRLEGRRQRADRALAKLREVRGHIANAHRCIEGSADQRTCIKAAKRALRQAEAVLR